MQDRFNIWKAYNITYHSNKGEKSLDHLNRFIKRIWKNLTLIQKLAKCLSHSHLVAGNTGAQEDPVRFSKWNKGSSWWFTCSFISTHSGCGIFQPATIPRPLGFPGKPDVHRHVVRHIYAHICTCSHTSRQCQKFTHDAGTEMHSGSTIHTDPGHARHTPHQASQAYTCQTPGPTHKYTDVYTAGSHTVPQAEIAVEVPAQICTPTDKDIHTHCPPRPGDSHRHHNHRHVHAHTSRRTCRDSTNTHPQVHTHSAAGAQMCWHTATPAHVARVLRNSVLSHARAHTHADTGARPAHRQRLQPAVPGPVLPHSGDAASSPGAPAPLPTSARAVTWMNRQKYGRGGGGG